MSILRRITNLFHRSKLDQEIEAELRSHIELRTVDNIAAGMSPEEARRDALLRFGNRAVLKERVTEADAHMLLDSLWQDLCYGLRVLRRSPSFTAVTVLTLALAIGANTAIFSMTYGILLKPLPYPDPARLVQLWVGNAAERRIAYMRTQDFREIAAQSEAFEQLAEYTEGGVKIVGVGGPQGVQTSFVSGNFFSVLGARPILGRPILPADAQPGHDQVAVITYELWQQRYGGDPHIIGKEITLSDETVTGDAVANTPQARPFAVVGVMPSRFPFPNHGDLLLPLNSWDNQFQLIAIGKLKPGVSIAAANAELHTIATRVAAAAPARHKNFDLSVGLLRDRMSEGYSTELLILLGAATFVLLLGCVNAASLLIARSCTRRQEVAIRETLGATRGRLIRQLLCESVLLSLFGASLALLFAHWGINLMRGMLPSYTPRLDEIGLDQSVFAYTLIVSVLAGILFGLAPAIQVTKRGPARPLKESKPASPLGFSSRGPHLKDLLVVGEISLVFVLVAGSVLALRSLSNLLKVKLGFRPAHVLTMYVEFSNAITTNPQRFKIAMNEVLERTRALPGVESSAFGMWLPIGGTTFTARAYLEGRVEPISVQYQLATPGYFAALGIPLLAGRSFDERDATDLASNSGKPNDTLQSTLASPEQKLRSSSVDRSGTHEGSSLVAIVNEAFAKRYFSGNPLGKQFRTSPFGGEPIEAQVVGEVGDTRDENWGAPPVPALYIPFGQVAHFPEATLFVRTAASPMAMAKAVREQIWTVDNEAPVDGLKTMDAALAERVAEPRFETLLLNTFAGLGLLLAIVGVYGLISYAVVQRTHEIGVRVALGAKPGHIVRMVLGEGLRLGLIGIAVGVAGALALTRFVHSLLFEIKPTDPVTFIGVAILLALVALAACYIPARHAMRVDPVVALRYE